MTLRHGGTLGGNLFPRDTDQWTQQEVRPPSRPATDPLNPLTRTETTMIRLPRLISRSALALAQMLGAVTSLADTLRVSAIPDQAPKMSRSPAN